MTSKLQKDLRRKVAKLLVVRASGHALDSQRKYPAWELSNEALQTLLKGGVGGVILHGGSVNELQQRCQRLRSWSSHPILLCADVEEGVGQRFEGGTWLPPPMALGKKYLKDAKEAILLAEEYGRCIGHQARLCGLNWVLAPVCDVNSNPLNPVINMRAWGTNPQIVSELASAFHKGLVSQGVLSCAKHFPGHGDTRVDSHLELPIIDNNLERLEEIEFVPFKALIDEGVNSVMTAHVLLNKIDSTYLATFSKEVLTGLLRKKIGFDRIVVTDALIMKAISNQYGCGEAAVLAFEAGADLILMPENPFQAIDAIVESLINGRVSIERLEESLERRRKEISKLDNKLVESINEDRSTEFIEFGDPNDINLLNKMLASSIYIKNSFDCEGVEQLINLVRVDDILPCPYLSLDSPTLAIPKHFGFQNILIHPLGISPWKGKDTNQLDLDQFGCGSFLLQLFIRGNPFRGQNDIDEQWISIVQQLQSHNRLSAIVIYGSCYFWEKLLKILNPSIPAAYSSGQMPAAQLIILESFLKFKNNQVKIKNNSIEFTN